MIFSIDLSVEVFDILFYSIPKFPKSGKIIPKDSEYPDFHGDYWAAAIIEVNEKDFKKLKNEFKSSENFIVDTSNQNIGVTKEFDNLIKNIKHEDITIVFFNKMKEWFIIAFLKDGKTIILKEVALEKENNYLEL